MGGGCLGESLTSSTVGCHASALGPNERWRRTGDYLQPAAASRRAYILPMSPMPMMPTVKPSMPSGTWAVCDEAAIFADQPAAESGTELARNGSHSSSPDALVDGSLLPGAREV